MNTSPASIIGILDRLAIGVSRTSIRHSSTRRKPRPKNLKWTGFKPGHGERIYVYNHIQDGIVVYSHQNGLEREDTHALSQIPFTVKKQKPAVIRRDYWQAMCVIQFPKGLGEVGRRVFHNLRELRAAHELEWDWQADAFKDMTRQERGAHILNQKANSVADIAAVLRGYGRGNLMRIKEPEETRKPKYKAIKTAKEVVKSDPAKESKSAVETGNETPMSEEEPLVTATEQAATAVSASLPEATNEANAANDKTSATEKNDKLSSPKRLHNVIIYWANDADKHWARSWTDNVEHFVGQPSGHRIWQWKSRDIMNEARKSKSKSQGASETESKARTQGVESIEEKEPEAERKKGWFSWLSGKSDTSPTSARL